MDTYIFSIDNKGNEELIAVKETSQWSATTEVQKLMAPGSTITGYTVVSPPQTGSLS